MICTKGLSLISLMSRNIQQATRLNLLQKSYSRRNDRWYWNRTIQGACNITIEENRQWKPAVAYCFYADDFVLIVKGSKAQVMVIRDQCQDLLEGFTFLGHRIMIARRQKGNMCIPHGKNRPYCILEARQMVST